jgi:antitoxin (DNA-binding transcriptional repressor) of toxin-antitoxin stability system
MGMPVVTVASGGMPVVDVTPIASMTPKKYGRAVTEATNGKGVRVTKVVGKPGLPVVYVVPPL